MDQNIKHFFANVGNSLWKSNEKHDFLSNRPITFVPWNFFSKSNLTHIFLPKQTSGHIYNWPWGEMVLHKTAESDAQITELFFLKTPVGVGYFLSFLFRYRITGGVYITYFVNRNVFSSYGRFVFVTEVWELLLTTSVKKTTIRWIYFIHVKVLIVSI